MASRARLLRATARSWRWRTAVPSKTILKSSAATGDPSFLHVLLLLLNNKISSFPLLSSDREGIVEMKSTYYLLFAGPLESVVNSTPSEIQMFKQVPEDSRTNYLFPSLLAGLLGVTNLETAYADADQVLVVDLLVILWLIFSIRLRSGV